jgi:hypothetical protein
MAAMKYVLWIWSIASLQDPTNFSWLRLGAVLDSRYNGQLKLKEWSFAIAKRSSRQG